MPHPLLGAEQEAVQHTADSATPSRKAETLENVSESMIARYHLPPSIATPPLPSSTIDRERVYDCPMPAPKASTPSNL